MVVYIDIIKILLEPDWEILMNIKEYSQPLKLLATFG